MRYANEVIVEQLSSDRALLKVHLCNAFKALFNNEVGVGCLMLRDIVNATIGFPKLAENLGYKDKGKGLMNKLTGNSNPTSDSLFAIIREVLDYESLTFKGAEIEDQEAA